jgi:RNA 3'-terminal phosphate cyclase
MELDIAVEYVEAPSPGSVITLWAETADGYVLGADALGENGKRSEVVGNEAANTLLAQIDTGAPVDEWLADQLIPVLAVTGGTVQVPEFTDHVEHNLHVAQQIVDKEWTVDRDSGRITVS